MSSRSAQTARVPPVAALLLCGAGLFAGCAVGPNYKRPAVNSPSAFRGEDEAHQQPFAELDWWQVYQDATLQTLIREAFTNNYDLRIAVTRVDQARAVAMQARSQFVPNVDYSGAVSRGRNDFLGSAFPNNGATANSAVATLNAFWEVDLWGRVRRLNESARAQFLASEEAQRGVRLSLLSDVATAYFQLLELDQELEIANRTTNSFSESLKIFTQRVEGGTASALESSRAEAALEDAAAAVPAIRERISATENELCILLGRNPGPIERRTRCWRNACRTFRRDCRPRCWNAGPDVRQTEQLLRSANAQVGESVAEFFPKIGLTAFLGKISPELSAFTLGGANAWGVAAGGNRPAFRGRQAGGTIPAGQGGHGTKPACNTNRRILNAFREVSDALVSRQQLADDSRASGARGAGAGRAVKLSSERYVAGKASYYEVLEAQQQLFPSELNLARTQRDQLLAVVVPLQSPRRRLAGRNETESAPLNGCRTSS